MVAALCTALGIAHATIALDLAGGSGVQARARAARYAALGEWMREGGLHALVTAHHADDQAETLVMRLNRGAGLRGLAGMRPVAAVPGHDLPLLRPLLRWHRATLGDVCRAAGVVAVDDPSNRDARFERARVRAAMAAADWIEPAGLGASAAHLAEADAALDWAAQQAMAGLRDDGAGGLAWMPDVPRAIALRVLERIVARIGSTTPRGAEVARWHDALATGGVATLAGVRGDGRGAQWRFTPAPPHRSGAAQ